MIYLITFQTIMYTNYVCLIMKIRKFANNNTINTPKHIFENVTLFLTVSWKTKYQNNYLTFPNSVVWFTSIFKTTFSRSAVHTDIKTHFTTIDVKMRKTNYWLSYCLLEGMLQQDCDKFWEGLNLFQINKILLLLKEILVCDLVFISYIFKWFNLPFLRLCYKCFSVPQTGYNSKSHVSHEHLSTDVHSMNVIFRQTLDWMRWTGA